MNRRDPTEGYSRVIHVVWMVGCFTICLGCSSFLGCSTDDAPTANISVGPDATDPKPSEQHERELPTIKKDATEVSALRVAQAEDPAESKDHNDSTNDLNSLEDFDFDGENLPQPHVFLSREHEETCLVTTGDVFPSLEITTMSGETELIQKFVGKRLTVIVFWTLNGPFAREQYDYLANEVYQPFHPAGVRVVAVNVGDSMDEVKARIKEFGTHFTNLVDPQQSAFRKIARRKLPRTYLLDGEGKILWFDIEYSRATRRDLNRALRYYLTQLQ